MPLGAAADVAIAAAATPMTQTGGVWAGVPSDILMAATTTTMAATTTITMDTVATTTATTKTTGSQDGTSGLLRPRAASGASSGSGSSASIGSASGSGSSSGVFVRRAGVASRPAYLGRSPSSGSRRPSLMGLTDGGARQREGGGSVRGVMSRRASGDGSQAASRIGDSDGGGGSSSAFGSHATFSQHPRSLSSTLNVGLVTSDLARAFDFSAALGRSEDASDCSGGVNTDDDDDEVQACAECGARVGSNHSPCVCKSAIKPARGVYPTDSLQTFASSLSLAIPGTPDPSEVLEAAVAALFERVVPVDARMVVALMQHSGVLRAAMDMASVWLAPDGDLKLRVEQANAYHDAAFGLIDSGSAGDVDTVLALVLMFEHCLDVQRCDLARTGWPGGAAIAAGS
nr:hypothetical protein HK105_001302 [Polyrhizophydium stewartii]